MAPSGHRGADPARFVFGPERTWDDDPQIADGAVSRVVVLGYIHGGTPPLLEALAIAETVGAVRLCQTAAHTARRGGDPTRHPHPERSRRSWAASGRHSGPFSASTGPIRP